VPWDMFVIWSHSCLSQSATTNSPDTWEGKHLASFSALRYVCHIFLSLDTCLPHCGLSYG
jgi:hypothetical protein